MSLPDLEDTEGHCIQFIRDIPMIILTDRYITSMWSLYRERSNNYRSLYTGQLRYSDWSVCSDKTLYCIQCFPRRESYAVKCVLQKVSSVISGPGSSLPSFLSLLSCAFIYLSPLCSTTLKFKMFLLLVNIASTDFFFIPFDVYFLCEGYAIYDIIFQHSHLSS